MKIIVDDKNVVDDLVVDLHNLFRTYNIKYEMED